LAMESLQRAGIPSYDKVVSHLQRRGIPTSFYTRKAPAEFTCMETIVSNMNVSLMGFQFWAMPIVPFTSLISHQIPRLLLSPA
jgi:hypothetical protein